MQFLQHLRYPLVALMAAPNVSLAHTVGDRLPGVAASGQDHQREQPRRRETEGLALNEAHLDQSARLSELVAIARLQGVGDAHGAARHFLNAVLEAARDFRGIGQPETPSSNQGQHS
ncbi:hypothetical protein [Phenylobacterium sp.]|uniref:hypothetical protein n=1 Tax=Phenylobacterium sp. TaxID=1871053 RepID=UPI0027363BF8|nr:hypothetical protein [Phenylobacterium sp.]MDP3592863.1 hypothetical protein [Phenylobacterium sp.]